MAEYLLKDLEYDLICAVSYAAIPLAVNLSGLINIPMLMQFNDQTSCSTKKPIEGIYMKGKSALIVQDVISSGRFCQMLQSAAADCIKLD